MIFRFLLTTCLLVDAALALSTASTTSTPSRPRLAFKGLDEASFRHALDRDLTSFVRAAPLNGIAQEALRRSASVVEQGLRLDLLSSAVKVSPKQLPELHESLVEACRVLDLEGPPELYVQSSPQANAYTLALRGKTSPPIVVITSALLDRCSDREIQAIIGHELGHLKCEHSLYLTLGGLVSTPLRSLPFVGASTERLLEQWRLAAECTCDRAAMLVAQDTKVVAGAMLKLFAGTNHQSLNTEAFVAQCVEYESLLKSANPLVRASINMQQRTHPLPVKRVAELEKWAQSNEYQQILLSGTELDKENEEKPVE